MKIIKYNVDYVNPETCGICKKKFQHGENIGVASIHVKSEDIDAIVFFHIDCTAEFFKKAPVPKDKNNAKG